jgi:Lar family restriction alleviation protein
LIKPWWEDNILEELIKKCPNCGSDDISVRETLIGTYWVHCYDCGVAGRTGASKDEAIYNWNEGIREIQCDTKLLECIFSGNFDTITIKELREHVRKLTWEGKENIHEHN